VSAAQTPMLELLLAAQSLCWSITVHSPAQKSRFLLLCDGVFSHSKGTVYWKGESSAPAIHLKAVEELFPRKKEKMPHFSFARL